MSSPQIRGIDRYTLMADLAPGVSKLINQSLIPLTGIIALLTLYLAFSHSIGTIGFALMGAGTCIVLSLWAKQGIGLPLLPMIAIQHLFAYAMPILANDELVVAYPSSYLLQAGVEVLVFMLALGGGWRFGMRTMKPSPPRAYTLHIMAKGGGRGLRKIGYGLITFTTLYYLLQSLSLLDTFTRILPSGSDSLVNGLVSAAGMCGFFVIALGIGSGEIPARSSVVFWGLFIFNCFISASALLLSASTSFVATVFIGLFWGSKRIPWKFITLVILILGFLNLGKFEMRNRYWMATDDFIPSIPLSAMPARYLEWADASLAVITANDDNTGKRNLKKDNSILSRVNNLQNLLFVIDAVDRENIPLLYGATYTLIPPLLIPRIFWPEKPRSHEGQVLLNVHFGRQDMISSYRTYIAWGLLPEAYGNFGPFAGSIILGFVLGLFIAWVENFSAYKPLLSMEGFLVFTLFLNMAASFEMVASVLVTSIFQSLIPIILACIPFVYRSSSVRPEEETS